MPLLLRAVVVLAVVAVLGACTDPTPAPSPSASATTSGGPEVRIGVAPEAESILLATVMAELLDDAGMTPALVELADAGAVRQALELGDVDVATGYTGQAWLEEFGRENPPGDPRTSFQRVRSADEPNGIIWLRPEFDLDAGVDGPPADATFGLFVSPATATEVATIPQLATVLAERPDAAICVDPEFGERDDGWNALAARYSITNRVLTAAPPAEAMSGVVSGDCFVGLSTLTDGLAWVDGLVPLEDPLEVFPAFVVSVQVREDALEELDGLEAALQPLASDLTTRMLGTWNARVVQGDLLEDIATDAVAELGVEPGGEDGPGAASSSPTGDG
ncbi:glycine betaine ABC transporter substrate-binding protein [Salsipaludibacter albus]|uniref:glycine betaine ABC transporter substrate-binding protein n=1 Tax=Salsipaludibacter albus TaxID=2849650 RepID=UPI001EE3C82C|nr:hypothetical protein [Salsipaludibacter albus]